jgi:hypothetical protein
VKYEVEEYKRFATHLFCVNDRGNNVACFSVADYGLDEARRRAEAECAFLNAKAEKWAVVDDEFAGNSNTRRFRVWPKNGGGAAGVFFVNELGHDLARSEAERLCKILNDLDASK